MLVRYYARPPKHSPPSLRQPRPRRGDPRTLRVPFRSFDGAMHFTVASIPCLINWQTSCLLSSSSSSSSSLLLLLQAVAFNSRLTVGPLATPKIQSSIEQPNGLRLVGRFIQDEPTVDRIVARSPIGRARVLIVSRPRLRRRQRQLSARSVLNAGKMSCRSEEQQGRPTYSIVANSQCQDAMMKPMIFFFGSRPIKFAETSPLVLSFVSFNRQPHRRSQWSAPLAVMVVDATRRAPCSWSVVTQINATICIETSSSPLPGGIREWTSGGGGENNDLV
jgi:hypothetical protein